MSPQIQRNDSRAQIREDIVAEHLPNLLEGDIVCVLDYPDAPLTQADLNLMMCQILSGLLAQQGSPVEFTTEAAGLKLGFKQQRDSIMLTVAKQLIPICYITPENIKQNIFKHLFRQPELYPVDTLKMAMKSLFQKSNDYSELTKKAICHAVNHLEFHSDADLMLAAAEAVFKHPQNYNEEILQKLIRCVVNLFKHNESTTDEEVVQFIFNNQKHPDSVATQCAVMLVLSSFDVFNRETFKLAVNYLATHKVALTKDKKIAIALHYIKLNESFFKAPFLFREVFSLFYKEKNKEDDIQKYAEKLWNTLSSKTLTVKVKDEFGKTQIQNLSIQSVWISGGFEFALDANPTIADFIFHPSNNWDMDLWNADPANSLENLEKRYGKPTQFLPSIIGLTRLGKRLLKPEGPVNAAPMPKSRANSAGTPKP